MVQDCILPENIASALKSMVKECKSIPEISRVILFGSYSKGSHTAESDVDVAFFIKESGESIFDIYKKVAKICCRYTVDIQPQIFYESEQAEPMGIVEEVIEHGLDITEI